MLQALLITFREGIESFLIVGVIAAYLRKIERADLLRAVQAGIALSLVTSALGAWLWLQVPNQPVYEGTAALAAAGLVGALLWQTLRAGRRIKGQIERRLEGVARETVPGWRTRRAFLGVAAVTALLVTREGLEAIFFIGVQVLAARHGDRTSAVGLVAGAVGGLAVAAVVAWGWVRFSRRVNLPVVLKVTALFLALFLVQLLVYGVHELAESGVIQGSQAFHDATERFGPDGDIGHVISYTLLAAPLLYLVWARAARSRPPERAAAARDAHVFARR